MSFAPLKAAVITFPGSNCDDDCTFVLRRFCGFEVDSLWHKETFNPRKYDLVVLPGGFSYGDYLRSGAIASVSPVMRSVQEYAATGGMLLGICNGFQMLCEIRLLPGALVKNRDGKFICRDVTLKVTAVSPWTCAAKEGDLITLPIAHGDGRFVVPAVPHDEYQMLKERAQIVLTYVSADGGFCDGANPNGSDHAIAGICNEAKNVFGLMPHPERATDLRSKDGLKIWESVAKTLREKKPWG